jgi:glutathione S-transferase
MAEAMLTITSRNTVRGPWRGWLLCRLAGLEVAVVEQPAHEEALPTGRAERGHCRAISAEMHGGFGARPTVADAMYAPVCTRLWTYDVDLGPASADYRDTILALEPMREWTTVALLEPDRVEELEMEF